MHQGGNLHENVSLSGDDKSKLVNQAAMDKFRFLSAKILPAHYANEIIVINIIFISFVRCSTEVHSRAKNQNGLMDLKPIRYISKLYFK